MNDEEIKTAAQRVIVEASVKNILLGLGEKPDGLGELREGLKGTPARVAKFYEEFFSPQQFEFTTFDNDGSSEMIVQSDIEFHSLCEHHLLPFYGTAAVAYIPNKRIVGISKLARCVDSHARRFQNQERITKQVADTLMEALTTRAQVPVISFCENSAKDTIDERTDIQRPLGVAVVLRARHLCMEMRGIKKRGAITTTSCLLGVFRSQPETRAEFLSLANNLKV